VDVACCSWERWLQVVRLGRTASTQAYEKLKHLNEHCWQVHYYCCCWNCWVQSVLYSWDYLMINPVLSWTKFTLIFAFSHWNKIQDCICDGRWKTCKISFKLLTVTELYFINLRSDLFWYLKRLKEISCGVKLGVQCHRSFWNGFVMRPFWKLWLHIFGAVWI